MIIHAPAPRDGAPVSVAIVDGLLAERDGTPDVELLEGWTITPGLIDLQVNGAGDAFPLEDPSSLGRLDALLAAGGVTSWCVAAPTAERAQVEGLARAAEEYRRKAGGGLLGVHLEGPVLSPEHPGAHPPALLRDGDDPDVRALLDLPGIRLVTLAPEVPGAMGYAGEAMARGLVVAAGHSGASFEQARAAIDDGVRLATHLFNAMAPVHQRAPGIGVAYLLDPRARVGFIADGEHLHPAIVELIMTVARDRALLVSDAAPDAGIALHRSAPAGVLAGSARTLADAVALVAASHGFTEAVRMASGAPALTLGLGDRGALLPGLRADLTIWDGDDRVAGTVRAGQVAFSSDELRARL